MFRSFSCLHIISEIVEYHIAIEYFGLSAQGTFRKAIVVIPWFHVCKDCIHIGISTYLSYTLIIGYHVINILCREAEHLVEYRLGRYVPSNVETAGQVIECNRADSCHENAGKHPLEYLEYLSVESAGVCQCPIHLLAVLVEHDIGEVIVFIDDEIELVALLGSLKVDGIQFCRSTFGCFYRFYC